jgi:gamma-glutamyltranspeptidase/glutathione hydrolase
MEATPQQASSRTQAVPGGGRLIAIIAAGCLVLTLASCAAEGINGTLGTGAPRTSATGTRHMIAAGHPLAAEAGRRILRAGGGAIDAAIAAALALNVVEPQASGIGGGGFLMHFAAGKGEIAAYDGREAAPAKAHPYLFIADGKPMAFLDAAVGGRAVGVPGLLRLFEAAHREHGRLPWAKLFEPAIELAQDGFPVSQRLSAAIAAAPRLKTFPAAAAYFHDEEGQPLKAGATLRNTVLAETFRVIAERGADAFYKGAIARDIAAAVQMAPVNPGEMTADDLAGYQAKKRDPVCLAYRAWLACGMPPPSSGGVATLQILGVLEKFDLKALAPASAEAVHLIAEASKLAFADRAVYIGDPDFVAVPTAGLLDPEYLKLRAAEVTRGKSAGRAQPGMPGSRADARGGDGLEPGESTSHISVIDSHGNAVALTVSIETRFGSRLMVHGFLLNNQLTDFDFDPNVGGAPVANRPFAGKRPRSSMAPTLVLDSQGRVVLAVGSPGGSRIIGYVAKVLVATLDWNRNVAEAVRMPNFVNRNGATELEKGTAVEALKPALEAIGHAVEARELMSGLHAVSASGSALSGAADPRREGAALGD